VEVEGGKIKIRARFLLSARVAPMKCREKLEKILKRPSRAEGSGVIRLLSSEESEGFREFAEGSERSAGGHEIRVAKGPYGK
jgi:hypothetical protein